MFRSYGPENLYDFDTNVRIWLLDDVESGESILETAKLREGYRLSRGSHFASPSHQLSGVASPVPRDERRRERGIRLVRTAQMTGWGATSRGK